MKFIISFLGMVAQICLTFALVFCLGATAKLLCMTFAAGWKMF